MKRNRTIHVIRSSAIREPLRLAVAADLHSAPFDDVLEDFRACDAVLIPGDLVDRHRKNNGNAIRFLQEVPSILPVFYAIGNHERKYRLADEYRERIRESGAVLLDNASCEFRGIRIGGLSSTASRIPDMTFLDRFERESGFRLLMCHHPEMYRDYVRGREIDFTVCGHAHGGQIQIGGRGLYAPGQGLFPKLTHGLHDGGKMMISRGMTNGAKPRIPRICNPCELIILELEPSVQGPDPRPQVPGDGKTYGHSGCLFGDRMIKKEGGWKAVNEEDVKLMMEWFENNKDHKLNFVEKEAIKLAVKKANTVGDLMQTALNLLKK